MPYCTVIVFEEKKIKRPKLAIGFHYTHFNYNPKFTAVSYQYISTTMYLVTLLRWVDWAFSKFHSASPHKAGTQLKNNNTQAPKLKWRDRGQNRPIPNKHQVLIVKNHHFTWLYGLAKVPVEVKKCRRPQNKFQKNFKW